MGDKMTPMPFSQLVEWVLLEYRTKGSVFGIHCPYKAKSNYCRILFDRKLETPVGPAAGPQTQLAQNLAAAYFAGGRFFELKTVQIIDGEELPVSKPCIRADDECYNVEWSTELYVPQAQEEYIKAWFLMHVMAKEFGLGDSGGFQFNMSVGYDLAGIKSPKIDGFIETMKNAGESPVFQECMRYLTERLSLFEKLTVQDIRDISPYICNSATLSTLHGCPSQEIEKIASYLIEEKGLHTFIKCNPTLLGYEFARKTMDEMGYDYVSFGDFHFRDDLQYDEAAVMFKRLRKLAAGRELEFGVKLTNTFPVDIKNGELPGEEMYMSGKALYPLTIALASRLSETFQGGLKISYSGGADAFNVKSIVDAGIWPVTVATTLLKPGGYQRLKQMAENSRKGDAVFLSVDVEAVKELARLAVRDRRHTKAIKPLPSRKIKERVPLTDCFLAPCREGCPIRQDIPAYVKLVKEGKLLEALSLIVEKNPLPFITGTICAHPCMNKCARNFYEDPVQIRHMKLLAAKGGYGDLLEALKNPSGKAVKRRGRAAVVGGGPAGMAAAYFLARDGMAVTLMEQGPSLGGVVRRAIPSFRIPDEAIDKDVSLLEAMGAGVRLNTKVRDIRELKEQGYDYILLAVGAYEPGTLMLSEGKARDALDFLKECKEKGESLSVGKEVVVVGGGNTAMDTARAAARLKGTEHVRLVYRRTRRYMPADEEELSQALEDGVEFMELMSPLAIRGRTLVCRVTKLGEPDASGRRSVVDTDETVEIPADTVIAAVGERAPSGFYRENGIPTDERGFALTDDKSLETGAQGVYVIGDGRSGPATVVEAIRDAGKACRAILLQDSAQAAAPDSGEQAAAADRDVREEETEIYLRRGILLDPAEDKEEGGRCLSCSNICENCVEVCPNRANLSIRVKGMEKHQIIHVDAMCNECGNCRSFCPYDSAPYLHKFTLFSTREDMDNSENQGFLVLDSKTLECRVRYLGNLYHIKEGKREPQVPEELFQIIKAVCEDYGYLLA